MMAAVPSNSAWQAQKNGISAPWLLSLGVDDTQLSEIQIWQGKYGPSAWEDEVLGEHAS